MSDRTINGYRLLAPLKNDASGNGKWGFAVKDGIQVFIKEFLTPVYPLDRSLFTEERWKKNLDQCRAFEKRKIRFYSELFKCRNGNIISVIDFFRYKTKYYVITEKVNNASLSLKDLFRMDTARKLILLKVIANSVYELHSHGIIHADLKPDNILIKRTRTGAYTAKIIDFDSGFLQDDCPEADEIQGDVVYLAPETYRYMAGGPVKLNTKLDVFALGVFFYQILYGKLPEYRGNQYEYAFEAASDRAELILEDTVAPEIRKLIAGMLEPGQRKRMDMKKVVKVLWRY